MAVIVSRRHKGGADSDALCGRISLFGAQLAVLKHLGPVSCIEADDRQVTTVFTVQPSFHHRHSTNRVSGSVTIVGERRSDCTFADDGNAS